ncbi:MAG: hypothetical protein BWX59_02094 [Bacteroidetes bacterium ADurb.Bin028]|nr:MAG: hypothetical protein BWX59_02094 [Bacteroidetes bacterium ADurb.Bin028]
MLSSSGIALKLISNFPLSSSFVSPKAISFEEKEYGEYLLQIGLRTTEYVTLASVKAVPA